MRKSENKELIANNAVAFKEVLAIIERARESAFRAVNRELISMYWEIGQYISEKCKTAGWGKSVVADFSDFVQSRYEGIKGFSPQNIWRMKQFYEIYAENEKLATLLREISCRIRIKPQYIARADCRLSNPFAEESVA